MIMHSEQTAPILKQLLSLCRLFCFFTSSALLHCTLWIYQQHLESQQIYQQINLYLLRDII